MDTTTSLCHRIPSHWLAHKTFDNENYTHHQSAYKKTLQEDRRAFATQRSYRAGLHADDCRIANHVDRHASNLDFLELYYAVSRDTKKHNVRSNFDNSSADLCHREHGECSKGKD